MPADEITAILEDTKERLKLAMPGQHFWFLLMPVDPAQMNQLSTEAVEQVNKRMVRILQIEVNQAIVDQRRET